MSLRNMWWYHLPAFVWCVWVFALGLGVGSFLNVVVARLPYQKSIVWPNSRCFTCLRALRFTDNLPILGYLRLRGRCRFCGATFSSRYLWVEVGTGLAFLGLFAVEVLSHAGNGPDVLRPWHFAPGLGFSYFSSVPPTHVWVYFAYHAFFLTLLIAAALIDLDHRIIPPQITYLGTLVGLIGATLMPWPWPSAVTAVPAPNAYWWAPGTLIPTGVALWPFIGPPPAWAPPGSWQLGLANGLVGAAAGMFIGRAIKFLFETGMRKDALGLGDADMLMMIGAFLGWQPAALALPVGAVLTLPLILPPKIWGWLRGRPSESELAFGPGIAAGAVAVWIGWPWLGESARLMFDPWLVGVIGILAGGGMLVSGLLFRRGR
ncbi:MAG: prepilin peptidase [Fimbriiglobus sp.]